MFTLKLCKLCSGNKQSPTQKLCHDLIKTHIFLSSITDLHLLATVFCFFFYFCCFQSSVNKDLIVDLIRVTNLRTTVKKTSH